MPEIKLTNVTKRWGKFYAVENLNLDIDNNSFITLLGPSGCGKTTTLRMIAGLETPTSGRITIGDRVVFDSEKGINVPANKRKVGFLFQNYALWPNMTVYKNIAFGLNNIKDDFAKVDYDSKVAARMAEILSNPKEMTDLVEECRDKKGNIDVSRAQLMLIDHYTISMMTAKKLLALNLNASNDAGKKAEAKIAELKLKIEKNKQALSSKGISLNENFELVKDGKVIVEKRKMTEEEIDLAVRRVSRIVKIGMFMDRYPAELSGGQQQRVAIARTLAPEPTVLFMDEPLSNLDAKLRLEMRYELQRLHVETGSTFVYVTHDQMEAMTLATKICLINNGVLQQYEPPLSVYNKPNNLFVADFVGNPSINFIEGKGTQGQDGGLSLKVFGEHNAVFRAKESLDLGKWFAERDRLKEVEESERLRLSKDKKYVEKANKDEVFKYNIPKAVEDDFGILEDAEPTNEDFVLGVRPEFIHIVDDDGIEGVVYGAMPTGMESTVKVAVGNFLLTSVIFGGVIYKIGDKKKIRIDGDNVMLFDRKSGRLITTGSLDIM
ncbi:MAG: ABC transporter ATP-binding protein [Lachnospiraceae bacterium]|nr:ABC transporter ATP-binding protein [Lachnospiraceae bacterium]